MLPTFSRWRKGSGMRPSAFPVLMLAMIPLVVPAPATAGYPALSKDEGPFPEVVTRVLSRDPSAYSPSRAWINEMRAKKENRLRIEQGLLNTSGMTEQEIRALTMMRGTKTIPVLLGKYSDTGADPYPRADFQAELFDGPWPTGTLSQYYNQVSYGNLTLTGTVYDWVTASSDDDYYAGTAYGLDPVFSHTGAFITELLNARDAGIDFGAFDNDGPDGVPNSGDDDGYVDFIAVIHPEAGGNCTDIVNDIWPHSWHLSAWPEGQFTTDDPAAGGGSIRIDDYTIMPAIACDGAWMIEIGVFCHEFGHALGLRDYYDTEKSGTGCTYGKSAGVGHWCLMGSGDRNSWEHPSHMSAMTKMELGWLSPGTVPSDLINWPLQSSTTTPTALKLWTGGSPGAEYFLVEYRRRVGFDDQLHSEGILVWHVDENVDDNKNECHKRLDLECEDQTGADHVVDADDLDKFDYSGTYGNRGDATDPFCDGETFTAATSPSSDAYNGVATNVQITGITGCGGANVRANFTVGQTPSGVNLCMRDCGSDVCTEPSPCDVFWRSPEIYIDNNDDGIMDPPADGIPNRLFARVRNVGGGSAVDVDVDFYYTNPALGQLFPSTGTLIDRANIPLIAAGTSEYAEVSWTIPVPPPDIEHYCVGVIASNTQDPQNAEYAPNDDNLVQINMQELYRRAGDAVPPVLGPPPPAEGTDAAGEPYLPGIFSVPTGLPGGAATTPDEGDREIFETIQRVMLCNPLSSPCMFTVRIGSPPTYTDAVIPADWTVDLQYTQVYLSPHQCQPLLIRVRDLEPVHTDYAFIPITLVCNNQIPVGGVTFRFEIDNVNPKCTEGFTVAHTYPPEGDDDPAEGAIRISWQDNFNDVLGFPERVVRWLIYRGDNPNFVPGSGNMIAHTCLDEDLETVAYDHFVDPPLDPAEEWYKMIAVDRAGNMSDVCTARVVYLSAGVNEDEAVLRRDVFLQNAPNPFRDRTQITYGIPREADVQLAIYSSDGRLVRELLAGRQPAGRHATFWDGTDAAGRPAAGGFYVCRLLSEGVKRSGRLLLLR